MNARIPTFLILTVASVFLGFSPLHAAPASAAQRQVHFVEAGEDVAGIAKKYLGDAEAAGELRAYNQIAEDAAVTAGFPMVIPGQDRVEAMGVLDRADAAMKDAVKAKASEYALPEFQKAVDVLNAAISSRNAASYVRAKVLAEVAIEQFNSAADASARNAQKSEKAVVRSLQGQAAVAADGKSQDLKVKAGLAPGQVLTVSPNSRVALDLPGGDALFVTGPAVVHIVTLQMDQRNQVLSSALSLTQGEVEWQVADGKSEGSVTSLTAGGGGAGLLAGAYRVTARSGSDASLTALSGSASVQTESATMTVNEGEAVEIKSGRLGGLDRVPVAPTFTSPATSPLKTAQQVVDFTWTSVDSRGQYVFELSSTPDFQTLLVRRLLNEPTYRSDVLAPGSYHARVSAVKSGLQGPTSIPVALDIARNLELGFAGITHLERGDVYLVGPGSVIEALPTGETHSVSKVEYSVDGKTFNVSDAGIKLPEEGSFEIKARGVGADGEMGPVISRSFLVDGAIPDLRIHIGEVVDFPGYGKIRSLAVLVDDNTKVAGVKVSINGEEPQDYELPLKLSIYETYHLAIRAEDMFGNAAENVLTLEKVVKRAAPGPAPVAPEKSEKKKGVFSIF